jgi:hypothetical protein
MQIENIALADQVRMAAQKQNRIAAVIGSWLAKLAPVGSFAIAHFAPLNFTSTRGLFFWALLASCLAFSAPKVFKWARSTFGSVVEAIGFVGLTEGLSLAPHDVHWFLTAVSVDALLVLLVVNSITGAVRVSLSQRELRAAAKAQQVSETKTEPVILPVRKVSSSKKTAKKIKTTKRPAANKVEQPAPFANVA